MKGNTFAISFLVKKEKTNHNNEAPIYAMVTVNKQRVQVSTKRNINPKHWDNRRYEAKKSHHSAKELNSYLLVVKNRLYECYMELIQGNKPVTAQRIKDLYLRNSQTVIGTLIQVSTLHLEEMEKFLGKSTFYGNFKNYKTTHKYLLEFIHVFLKKKDIPLDEVNYSFIKQFEYFLQTQKNCNQNGMMKQMQRLKKVLNWAIKNQYFEQNPFRNYTISFKKYDRGYLTVEEISQIESLANLSKKLSYTKDFFVFQLYTGLAYSDMMDLTSEDIIRGVDNEYWIIKNRVKTDTKITVPLLPVALDIFLKYSTDKSGNEAIFPRISTQKVNKNLKELGQIAGISKPLSTHLARHTAATTVWLSNGVPIEVVSKMMGHTKISTTQIYGRVVESKIALEMKKLREKLI